MPPNKTSETMLNMAMPDHVDTSMGTQRHEEELAMNAPDKE